MANTLVHVRTVEKVSGSEDKFYRTYELPTGALFQWGSQRNGRSGGQFKLAPHAYDAHEQIDKKLNDGYSRIPRGDSVQITVDEDKLAMMLSRGAKSLGAFLDSLLASASPSSGQPQRPSAPATPQPDPAAPQDRKPVSVDRIAEVNKRALAAIALASTDPGQAITEYALLNGDVEDLETALRKVKSYMETLEILVSEEL